MIYKKIIKFRITEKMIDEINKARQKCGFEKEDYSEVGQERTILFG